MDLKIHTTKELVENSSFQRMVKGRASQDEIEIWNEWIESSDQNRRLAKSAIAEILGFEFKAPEKPDVEQKWAELYRKTAGKQKLSISSKRKDERKLRWIFRVAAILLLTSMVGFGVYHFSDVQNSVTHLAQVTEEKTINTAEGEQKTLQVSNGSKVILNSNSTLTYQMGLLHNETIEVVLEGEAWFDAKSDPSQKKPEFAVSTPDGIIRDIGTKFLVTTQSEGSRIVLQEGRVEVEYRSLNPNVREDNDENQKKFYVEKGELVEFSRVNDGLLKRKKVNPTLYTSWATGRMQLDETGIPEFAKNLEEDFDVKVKIVDPNLNGVTLDGAIYFKSLEDLIRSVGEVTGIPVYRSADRATVYIGNPNKK